MPINLDQDFVTALLHRMKPGEHVKIVHPYQMDGSECSLGKSAALNVIRTNEGIKCFCHRCNENGTLTGKNLSPERTIALLKRIKNVQQRDEMEQIDLPEDAVPIRDMAHNWKDNVPLDVKQWLWTNGLHMVNHVPLEWRWSPYYQRIIIPVFDHDDQTMVGWIGRSINPKAKELCIPKYITRKQKGYDKRLLYIADYSPETNKSKVIFCEDAISATKINAVTHVLGVALLTTHIDYDVLKRFPDSAYALWLDGDMNKKSMNKVKRLASLGYDITGIRTEKDPKHLFSDTLREEVDKAWQART